MAYMLRHEDANYSMCIPKQLGSEISKGYTLTRVLVAYIIPLGVISVATALSVRSLMRSIRESVTGASDRVRWGHRWTPRVLSRKKIVIVISVLSTMFFLAWIMYYVCEIWIDFYSVSFTTNPTALFLYLYSLIPIYTMCCLNPVALYVLSSRFRKQLFRDCFCCCGHINSLCICALPQIQVDANGHPAGHAGNA